MRRLGGGRPGVALLAIAGIACLVVFRADAVTRIVDGSGGAPYATIQSAIDDSMPGVDDVFVRCGHYPENVRMQDGVSLRGAGAPCTVVDGQGHSTVVTIPAVHLPTELSGFTLRNGAGSAVSFGAGVEILGGSPVVRRNIIEGNQGMGIFARDWDEPILRLAPVITRNVIRANGMCCYGGGILLDGADGAVVTSNLVVGNAAAYGAGIYALGSVEIAGNTLVGNVAQYYGGALVGQGTLAVRDNAMIDNHAGIAGGAVWAPNPAMTFAGNDAFGNTPDAYTVPEGDPTGTDGNVSVDPLFADRHENLAGFQLRSDSPLLEAATANAALHDLAGLPRPLDADVDGVSRIDIGARENDGPTRLHAAPDGFEWDPVRGQEIVYDVFRGDLSSLRATGIYTQDPGAVPGARHFCALETPRLLDAEAPAAGQTFFYLSAARGVVDGTLGFTSAAAERPRTGACLEP